MTCYHPLTAFKSKHDLTVNGKSVIRFSLPEGAFLYDYEEIKLPCGQCIGCRLERSRSWAVRGIHEAKYHKKNCFITLTYNEESMLSGCRCSGNLKFFKKDYVDFMKRFRKAIYPLKVRFFHCGEYGDKWQRPHHHAIIFGFDPDDKIPVSKSDLGFILYRSPFFERLWPYGFVRVGSCTVETIAYVARYITKKINGFDSYDHYYGRDPEYITMSRRPGIGFQYLMDHPEIYNYDEIKYVNFKGKTLTLKPPAYYDKLFGEMAPDYMDMIKKKRKVKALEKMNDNTFDRLLVKEEKKKLDTRTLRRNNEFID